MDAGGSTNSGLDRLCVARGFHSTFEESKCISVDRHCIGNEHEEIRATLSDEVRVPWWLLHLRVNALCRMYMPGIAG